MKLHNVSVENPINPFSFSFRFEDEIYTLPSIDCYNFTQTEIINFNKKGNYVPLVLDINISSPCNIMCRYCYTSHGKEDRFGVDTSIAKLDDSEIEEIIKQFGNIGGKVIFICSEGEPLFYLDKFINLARLARENKLRVITYTNTTKITEDIAKQLHELDVNLVLKLESLNQHKNNYILRSYNKYDYSNFYGKTIPLTIKNILEEYLDDKKNKIVLSSMLTNINVEDIFEIRKWAFEELGVGHFIKQLYFYGEASRNYKELYVGKNRLNKIINKIYEYDSLLGFKYPLNVPDIYSYDIRRFLNNAINNDGFPLRVFSHPRGGVYHNSAVVDVKFGFLDGICVSMRDENGRINLEKYFQKIYTNIKSGKT